MPLPRHRRLFWRLLPTYLAIVLVAVAATGSYAYFVAQDFYLHHTTRNLGELATFLIPQARDRLQRDDPGLLQSLCRELGHKSDTRITLIRPDGQVVCESAADPERLDNHADRPEVVAAQRDGVGHSVRYSRSVHKGMIYVARRIDDATGRAVGFARVSMPVADFNQTLNQVKREIALGSLLFLLIAGGISLWVSRRLTRQLEVVRRDAERIAAGDLAHPLPIPDIAEFAALAQGINHMLTELDRQLLSARRQRNALNGILDSMSEGVVSIDAERHIRNINPAACRLFGVRAEAVTGRPLGEGLVDPPLDHFAIAVLDGLGVRRTHLLHTEATDQLLQVSGTVLEERDEPNDRHHVRGAVLVFRDTGESLRLDAIRRDFVANVSHELRTPITSIKGLVETLHDEGWCRNETANRFLGTITNQVDRLVALVDDLLTLARIERIEERRDPIRLTRLPLRPAIDTAVLACRKAADQAGIAIHTRCSEHLEAWIDPPLLEQGLINLIDNAVKHAGGPGPVTIKAKAQGGETVLCVEDRGPGIPAPALPRLFERFYRVDPSRSRDLGGTGLGLAIVKHIVQAHGGHVRVFSEEGVGSRFCLYLPTSKAASATTARPPDDSRA